MESSSLPPTRLGQADSWPAADIHHDVLGRRLGAALADGVVLAVVFIVFAAVTHGFHSQTVTTANGAQLTTHAAILSPGYTWLFFVGGLVYYFAFEAMTGQTPGKMMAGLQVVGLDGRAASTGRILVRTLMRIVDSLPLFYLVGFISLVCGQAPRKRLGDRLAGTTVAPL